MSVWKTSCYKDDAFQSVYRVCPRGSAVCPVLLDLLDFDLPDTNDFSLPAGVAPGNAKRQAEKDSKFMEALVDRPRENRYNRTQEGVYKFLCSQSKAYHGLSAIYRLLAKNWTNIFKPAKDVVAESEFVKSLYIYGSAASYRTARDAKEKADFADEQLLKYISGPHAAVRSLITVATCGTSRNNKGINTYALATNEPLPELEARNKGVWGKYEIRWYKGVLYLTDPSVDEVYVLLAQDVERLEKKIMGFGWAGFYYNSYSDKEPEVTQKISVAFDLTVNYLRKVFNKIDSRKANFVCRALDVCLYTFLARNATDISDRALKEQEAKYLKEDLGKIIDINEILAPVEGLAYKEALEILHLYKVLPQPDYDIYGAAQRQKDMYSNVSTYGAEVENENTGTYDDLFRYQKHVMIQAFYSRHGVCPGTIEEGVELEGWTASYPHKHPK